MTTPLMTSRPREERAAWAVAYITKPIAPEQSFSQFVWWRLPIPTKTHYVSNSSQSGSSEELKRSLGRLKPNTRWNVP